jgi:hypothetical protein
VLVQRTVVADDQGAFGRIDSLDPFDLETDDGRTIRVHPSTDARVEPLREEKVKWGDLEDDPSYLALKDRGPGPHVTVTVKRAAICAGDRIALDGSEKDFVFEDETKATTRTAPTKKLSAVTADVIAGGDDPEKVLGHVVDAKPETKKPNEPKKSKKSKKEREREKKKLLSYVTAPRVLSFVALLIFAAAATMRVSPGFVDAVTAGISLWGTALIVASMRVMPRFVRGKFSVEETSKPVFATAVLACLLLCSLFIIALLQDFRWAWSLPPLGHPEPNASWLVGPGAAIFLVVLLVTFVLSTRKCGSLLGAIVDAPPFGAMPDETKWGSIEGVVRDPTPVAVAGAPRALASIVETKVRAGSDPDIVTESVLNQGTFFVDSDIGSFEIDPTRATWASAVRMVIKDEKDRHAFADVVAIGGHVVVAGRAVTPAKGEPARFVAGRAESLVFYATARDAGARARARLLLWRRRVAIAGLVVGIGAISGILAMYGPELPPIRIEGGGGDF